MLNDEDIECFDRFKNSESTFLFFLIPENMILRLYFETNIGHILFISNASIHHTHHTPTWQLNFLLKQAYHMFIFFFSFFFIVFIFLNELLGFYVIIALNISTMRHIVEFCIEFNGAKNCYID